MDPDPIRSGPDQILIRSRSDPILTRSGPNAIRSDVDPIRSDPILIRSQSDPILIDLDPIRPGSDQILIRSDQDPIPTRPGFFPPGGTFSFMKVLKRSYSDTPTY